MSGQNNDEIQNLARCLRLLATVSETCTDSSPLLLHLTVALSRAMPIGAAGVAVGEKLSLNVARRKPTVTACEECSREHQIEAVCLKHDREERERRKQAKHDREQLVGMVPDRWLKLPLTDAHARELGQTQFFRGRKCLRGHLAPYRINGGCLTCAGQTPSAGDWQSTKPKES